MQPDDATTIKSLPTKIEEMALEIAAAIAESSVFRSSIHDATGGAVWNSEETLNDSDRSFVLDALDTFALEPGRSSYEQDSPGPRGLVAYAARDPRGALHGAMLLDADRLTLPGRTGDRVTPVVLVRLLQQLALHLAGEQPRPLAPLSRHDDVAVTLYVQQLLSLRNSDRTRRYEVLLRADTSRPDPARTGSPARHDRPRRGSGQRRQAGSRGGRPAFSAGSPRTTSSWKWIRPGSR